MAIKKKTYRLKLNNILADFGLFQMCDFTPIPVLQVNGEIVQKTTGWMNSTEFPNPAATKMTTLFERNKKVLGETLASTVVDYKDKTTGQTIMMLFPDGTVMKTVEGDPMQYLNHDSKKDYLFQLGLRTKLFEKYKNISM